MADDSITKHEVHLRSITTRSVTLYPAKAFVVRDIKDIVLEPGANEIAIYGITPTADENSIKVDGIGSATINDMRIDLVSNPEHFADVYDSDDSDESVDESEDGEPLEESFEELRKVSDELRQNQTAIEAMEEAANVAEKKIALLEGLIEKVENPGADVLPNMVDVYGKQREEGFKKAEEAKLKVVELQRERDRILRAHTKAQIKAEKEREKMKKAERKAREKKRRELAEKRKKKQELKEERIKFWPKKVYRVVLSLDASSGMTPASSRRGSVEDLQKPAAIASGKEIETSDVCQVSLCLSYVTSAASWLPRYDLSINTLTSSGTILYRAEFKNTTSETWRDAKVILSTQQTTFRGLDEVIPALDPWHIRLQKAGGYKSIGAPIFSTQETNFKREAFNLAQDSFQNQNRAELFGAIPNSKMEMPKHMKKMRASGMNNMMPVGGTRGGHFGSMAPPPPPAPIVMASRRMASSSSPGGGGGEDHRRDQYDPTIEDSDTLTYAVGALDFQKSAWEETGLTATYDVPGLRTIVPNDTARRHKIATVDLKEIQLSYVCVPKLKTAAFLKAKITNTSGMTLLKGQAGLTLDGSFLGNANIPRCSAGESFPLSLGVDPSITVLYGRPGARKNVSTGFISREDSTLHTRSITITNTRKTGSPIDLTVTDQIPVSEDEKLRVEVLAPKGLRSEGDRVNAGQAPEKEESLARSNTSRSSVYSAEAARGGTVKDDKWGKAVAALKKAGEMEWTVKLNPGKAVRFALEYETRLPATDIVVSAN